MNWLPSCFRIKPVISGVMVPIARLLAGHVGDALLALLHTHDVWPEDIVHQEGQTSENLHLTEKIAVVSSSHEEDRNESFLRVSAVAEMIKQDRFEAYKL